MQSPVVHGRSRQTVQLLTNMPAISP